MISFVLLLELTKLLVAIGALVGGVFLAAKTLRKSKQPITDKESLDDPIIQGPDVLPPLL